MFSLHSWSFHFSNFSICFTVLNWTTVAKLAIMVLLCFVYVRKSVSFSSNLFSRLNIASIMVLLETSELLTWSANFAFLSAGFKSTPSPLDLHSGLCGIVVLRFWNAAFSLIVTWHLLIFGVQSQSSPFSTVFTISVKKLLHKSPSCTAHQPTLKVCQLKLKKKKIPGFTGVYTFSVSWAKAISMHFVFKSSYSKVLFYTLLVPLKLIKLIRSSPLLLWCIDNLCLHPLHQFSDRQTQTERERQTYRGRDRDKDRDRGREKDRKTQTDSGRLEGERDWHRQIQTRERKTHRETERERERERGGHR